MRQPSTAHPLLALHELTSDFQLEDVWALPTPGGPGELPRLVSQLVSGDFPQGAPSRHPRGVKRGSPRRSSTLRRMVEAPTYV